MGENLHIDIIVAPPGEALPCLKCGYDLRANAGDRCSECGWEIDRELLKGGWFPWERRQYRGRFISYVKTVWQVSVGSGKLAEAAERMHPLGDGRSFARWTGAMVMISLVGLFFVMVAHEELWRLAIAPQPDWPRQTPRPAWVEAVAVPWSAGVILPMVGPLMLAIFAFVVARMPKRLFVGKNANAPATQSARAVACYAAAPMAWLLPVAMLIALVRGTSVDVERFIGVGLMVAAIVIGLAGIVVRIRHAVKRTKANIWIMPAMLLIALL